jgi:hypothetical protein
MEQFKSRLRERTLDVLDWIDYRPDPHWWQYAAVPVVVLLAYFLTPMRMWPFVLAATIFATVMALACWLVGAIICVAWRAVRDIMGGLTRERTAPQWRVRAKLGEPTF